MLTLEAKAKKQIMKLKEFQLNKVSRWEKMKCRNLSYHEKAMHCPFKSENLTRCLLYINWLNTFLSDRLERFQNLF